MLHTIYGFDDLGRKVPTGSYDDGALPVGGRIFYIDSNSDETVEFYDAQGNVISNVAVGDMPAYYKVTGAGVSGKDKFYIYNSQGSLIEAPTSWGYQGILTDASGLSIGEGKSNTNLVLSIEYTSQSTLIWDSLKSINNNKLGSCADWFIGSKNELEELRLYMNSIEDTSIFDNYHYVRSSSENDSNRVHTWLINSWSSDAYILYAQTLMSIKCFGQAELVLKDTLDKTTRHNIWLEQASMWGGLIYHYLAICCFAQNKMTESAIYANEACLLEPENETFKLWKEQFLNIKDNKDGSNN